LQNNKKQKYVFMDEKKYLTGIPPVAEEHGLCKVLLVRHESIHLKHIFTEIFVRRKVDIYKILNALDLSLEEYMEIMTNRMRRIYNFSRHFIKNCDEIVKNKRISFFPTVEFYSGLKTVIVLDFDGVVTKNSFRELYRLCVQRNKTYICSANPGITEAWFEKKGLPLPAGIFSMKGKKKKLIQLIEILKKHDIVFFVDNEKEYLESAWAFGINTYHWDGKRIKYFSMQK